MKEVQALNPIRQARLKLNLSQAGLARAVGITLGAVSQAERGGVRRPHRLFSGIGRLGLDPAALEADYSAWLDEAQAAV